ncbi:MAG: RHS repeat-associated core domain-containing protein, partial [Chloroflexota bacterium]
MYLNTRYLDPATGTFLTRDPFEGMADSAMSRNPYSYTGGNPVNLLSPNGQTLTADGLRTKVTIIGHRDSDDTNKRLLIGLVALGVGVVVGAATFGALGPEAAFFVAALGEESAPFVGAATIGISGAISGQAVRATNNIGLGRQASVIPDRRESGNIQLTEPMVVPGQGQALPEGVRLVDELLWGGQACAFLTRTTSARVRRSRLIQRGIQAQPGDDRHGPHQAGTSIQEIQCRVSTV